MSAARMQTTGSGAVPSRKKLIEVALPLDDINKACAREKSIRHGHPSTLHLWWARRPLAAARAVIFAQMVDDPSSHPEVFVTEAAQENERQRLFRLLVDLVQWDHSESEDVLSRAREEIWKSWRSACADNEGSSDAGKLYDPKRLPAFCDPFAGGGSLPLEAQRLGLESFASDLNPVAVLVNKAMIEIPARFMDGAPVHPTERGQSAPIAGMFRGAHALAEDVRYYGQWIRDEAERRIGNQYPKIEVTPEMAADRLDLKPLIGSELTVIAWLWARTVKSPNPAFAASDVPLVSNFMLSTKPGKEAYVEPIIDGANYSFNVKIGKPDDVEKAKRGTKLARGANFGCILSGTPLSGEYIKSEGKSGRMGARLFAIAAEGDRGRVFLSPMPEHEAIAKAATPSWRPDVAISGSSQYLGVRPYGMDNFSQLFTDRQTVALSTFAELIEIARATVMRDALAAGLADERLSLDEGGRGATAYAEAVITYLALCVSKSSDYWSNLCTWRSDPKNLGVGHVFARQALAMTWDYVEGNPFSKSSGSWMVTVDWIARVIASAIVPQYVGHASQIDAREYENAFGRVVSTDPPYFDNVPYADLSDFFYVWLRHSLKETFPKLFATVAVPKSEELVAFAYRHENKEAAAKFFMDGMARSMRHLAEGAHPAFPVTIYYAFKQSESDGDDGNASTGWETFLEAIIDAGFAVCGTWPMRTELGNRVRNMGSNALASSIVLVCRRRHADAQTVTRRDFINVLKSELPPAVAHLQLSNIAPVDLAQSAIGPGMAVFTRYARVVDAEGKKLSVRDALTQINQTLDEVLADQEGDFDAESRWAIAWFEQFGFAEAEYGIAETLSKAKNTSVGGLVASGILASKGGMAHLLPPSDLAADWDPDVDARISAWEIVNQLVRILESSGEAGVAEILAKLGTKAEAARELAYRLYLICERKKRPREALSYNGLVQSWPEVIRLARGFEAAQVTQTHMFEAR